jgi:hypothetical protein
MSDVTTKGGSVHLAIEWVAENVGNAQPRLESAPSQLSKNLFAWANRDSQTKGDFIRHIWTKQLPSKAELDNEARFSESDDWLIEMIKGLLEKGPP